MIIIVVFLFHLLGIEAFVLNVKISLTPKYGETRLFESYNSRRDWLSVCSSTLLIPWEACYASQSSLCDPYVSSWYRGSRKVYLLGTAHISEDSAQAAGKLVREIRPQAVFLELDKKRVNRVSKDNDQSVLSSSSAIVSLLLYASFDLDIRGKFLRAGSAIVGDAIKGLYKGLEEEGFSPGEEFSIAMREGSNVGSDIILGDQDVDYTLGRLAEAISKTDIRKLLKADSDFEIALRKSLPDNIQDQLKGQDTLNAQQLSLFVESMKTKENIKQIMNVVKQQTPEVYQALVAERDLFMATGLDKLSQYDSVVAVMGLAHLDGVESSLQANGWKSISQKC